MLTAMCYSLLRVSYRGGWGGGAGTPPPQPQFPPPEVMELSMVIIVLSQVLNNNLVPDCIRSNLRGSKIQNFFSWKGREDPPSRHAHLCATIIMLPSCFPAPTQNPVWNSVQWAIRKTTQMYCNSPAHIIQWFYITFNINSEQTIQIYNATINRYIVW